MLGVVGSGLKKVKFEPTTPNTSQHVATGWPNAPNRLRPTMLRWHVAIVWPGLKFTGALGKRNNEVKCTFGNKY